MSTLTPQQGAALQRWGIELYGSVDDHPFAWWGLRDDTHVVVKAGEPAARIREAAALRALGPGAAAVVELDVDSGLLVTERILPGDDIRPLARIDDDAATRDVAELAVLLRQDQGSDDLPPLSAIGEAFDGARDPRIPDRLRDRAEEVFRELIATSTDDVVLHGDLHHMNVLNAGDGWRAIDPHGWVGDPAFEAAALLANPRGLVEEGDARFMDGRDLARRSARRASIYAEVAVLDLERVRAWGFVGCVIAELWMLESHDLVHGAPLAVAEVMMETL